MNEEAHKDSATLRRLYHDEGKDQQEIADQLGTTQPTISYWMRRHNIETRRWDQQRTGNEPYHDEDRLRELYHDEGLCQREIADKFGVKQATIWRWLNRHGIETKDRVAEMKATKLQDPVPLCLERHGYEVWRHSHEYKEESVRVHRLLAVAECGFDEVEGMDVHHKNGVQWDNRPDNIELLEHGEHTALHNKTGAAP